MNAVFDYDYDHDYDYDYTFTIKIPMREHGRHALVYKEAPGFRHGPRE